MIGYLQPSDPSAECVYQFSWVLVSLGMCQVSGSGQGPLVFTVGHIAHKRTEGTKKNPMKATNGERLASGSLGH